MSVQGKFLDRAFAELIDAARPLRRAAWVLGAVLEEELTQLTESKYKVMVAPPVIYATYWGMHSTAPVWLTVEEVLLHHLPFVHEACMNRMLRLEMPLPLTGREGMRFEEAVKGCISPRRSDLSLAPEIKEGDFWGALKVLCKYAPQVWEWTHNVVMLLRELLVPFYHDAFWVSYHMPGLAIEFLGGEDPRKGAARWHESDNLEDMLPHVFPELKEALYFFDLIISPSLSPVYTYELACRLLERCSITGEEAAKALSRHFNFASPRWPELEREVESLRAKRKKTKGGEGR